MRRLPDGWKKIFRGPLGLRIWTVVFLAAVLGAPLAALARDALRGGWDNFRDALTLPAAVGALRLTFRTAAAVSFVNAAMGTLIAYTLARHAFPGRRAVSALIDLPLAVPGLATGAALAVLYGPRAALGRPGIVLALLFTSLPLMVRAVQPLLIETDRDQEEAALSMGASPWTAFRRVLLPQLLPGIMAGAAMTFSRALGELAVVGAVAGNIPFKAQTAAVYVRGEMESGNQLGASAVSVVMIGASALLAFLVEAWRGRRAERRR